MGALGTLAATLKLEGGSAMTSGLRGIGSAASTAKMALSALSGPLALIGVSFAAFKSAAGIVDGLKGVVDSARELQTLSRATGQSVGDLKMLQGAFKSAGLSAEEVPATLRTMQRAIGGVNEEGQPTSATLQRLGLNIQQLKGMTAVQQLQAMQKAFAKLPDATSQGAAALQVFAREGQSMMALFNDPEAMAGLGKGLSAQAEIFQRNSAIFSRVSADLQALSGKTKGIFAGIAEGVAPVILPLLDKLKSIDLTPIGQQIGSIVRIVANAFKGGEIGELLGTSLKLGAMEGTNALWSGLSAAGSGFGAVIVASLRTSADMLTEMTNVQNWTGIGHALIAAGFSFESKLIEAGDYLQAGMDYAVSSSMHSLKSAMAEPLTYFQSNWVQALLNPMGLLTKVLMDAALGFGKAIKEALHGNLGGVTSAVSGMGSIATLLNPMGPSAALATAFAKSLASGVGDKPASLNDFVQKRLGESAATRGSLNSAAASEASQAGATLAPLATRWLKELKRNFEDVTKAIKDGLSAGPLLNTDETKQKLADLVKQLNTVGTAMSSAPSLAGGVPSLGGVAKPMEGDRLARIGGFIGGTGGPANDFLRRTAAASEKTAANTQGLLQQLMQGGMTGRMTSIWGG